MPSNQKQIIEQAKFTYSPLGKVFKKQTKPIEDHREKQLKVIEDNTKQLANTNPNIIKISYCFQRKKKYLRIFIMKHLIE